MRTVADLSPKFIAISEALKCFSRTGFHTVLEMLQSNCVHRGHAFLFNIARQLELGNVSILYRYRDMRLDIVLDFQYRNMA